jgi:hypothetical protein
VEGAVKYQLSQKRLLDPNYVEECDLNENCENEEMGENEEL